MKPGESTRMSVAKILPTIGILLVVWLLMWLVQGIPTVCALAYECPTADVRVAPALLFGGLMLVPTATLILTARGERPWAGLRTISYIAAVGLAIIGLGAVLFSGGFTIPSMF